MHFIAAKSSPLDFLWLKRKTVELAFRLLYHHRGTRIVGFYKKMSSPFRTQKITKMHLVMLQEE